MHSKFLLVIPLIEELHKCESEIRYYSKPVEEKFLKENENGKFSLWK